MDGEKLASALNDLLEYLNDSHMGYQQSSDAVKGEKVSSLLSTLAVKRKDMKKELTEKIKFMGEAPKEGGSIAGAAHRLFVNLKGAITGGNVDSIINEIKRGENTMINRYKEVLRENLPEDINKILTAHLSEFEKDLAEIDKASVS